MHVRLLVCLCVMVAISELSSASAGVVIIRPDELVVAADSKSILKTKDGRESPAASACKMGVVRNFVWIETGMTSTEFVPKTLMRQVGQTPGPLSKKARALVALASKALKGVLWQGESVMILMATLPKQGEPQIFARSFVGDKGAVTMPEKWQFECTTNCNEIGVVEIGEQNALNAVHQNPLSFDTASPIHFAKQLLEFEMQKSQYVGPPVSLLTITRTEGPEWQDKGVCP